MKNYKYQISGIGVVVVSEEEHLKIQNGAQQGVNIVYLREGKMGVNPIKIGFFEETNLLTKIQEEEKENRLKIGNKVFADFGKEKSDEQISWQAKKIRQIREDFMKNNFSMPI